MKIDNSHQCRDTNRKCNTNDGSDKKGRLQLIEISKKEIELVRPAVYKYLLP